MSGQFRNVSGQVRNISGQVRNMSDQVMIISDQVRNMSGKVRNMLGQVRNMLWTMPGWESKFERDFAGFKLFGLILTHLDILLTSRGPETVAPWLHGARQVLT